MASYIDELAKALRQGGIESPRLEARLIAAAVLELEADALLFAAPLADEGQLSLMKKMVSERLKHRPLDKILGTKGFYKYDFKVSEAVLSPRPDTEVLVEAAVSALQEDSRRRVLDLGTGSGCIVLSLLADCPAAEGVALDISSAALEIAAANAYQLGVEKRISFINGSWFDEDIISRLGGKFDIIVSNPPYIPAADIASLEAEVREHDPLSALEGGEDGLRDYRQISLLIHDLLNENGVLFLEVGIRQSADVAAIFTRQGLQLVDILKDLGGIERCVILKK